MARKIRRPLWLKFTLLIISMMMLMLLASSLANMGFVTRQVRSVLSRNFIADSRQLVEYFSQNIFSALKFDDELLLVDTFDRVKGIENADWALVFDSEKKIRLHSEVFNRAEADFTKNPKLAELASVKNKVSIQPAFHPDNLQSAYFMSKSFYDDNGRFLGMLVVKLSTDRLSALLEKTRLTLFIIMIIVLAVSSLAAAVFAFGLANLVARPIRKVTNFAVSIGEGNLDQKIDMKRSDEIGLLAETFNEMIVKLKQMQKMEKDQEVQNEQMKIAQAIQNAIFPGEALMLESFEAAGFSAAAKTIGGDYYNFRVIDDSHAYFLLADVSGKGVPAALVTFMIATVFQSLIRKTSNYDSGEVITEANDILTEEMSKFGRFATVCFGFWNLKTNTLNFVSAGHGNLKMYRAHSRIIEEIPDNGGMPVGVVAGMPYMSSETIMNPGDMVVLYTDGVNEARNINEEEFGDDRVRDVILPAASRPVTEILSIMDEKLKEFVGTRETHDDTTMILFRRKK